MAQRLPRSVDLGYDKLNEDYEDPNADVLTQVGRAARNALCGLYEFDPGSFEFNEVFSPIAGGARGLLLNRLCKPINKIPLPPANQFQGGQCSQIAYEVEFTTSESVVGNTGFRNENNLRRYTVFGPITGVDLEGSVVLEYQGAFLKCFSRLTITANVQQPSGNWMQQKVVYQVFGENDHRGFNAIGGTSVRRLDGQPDQCGNPNPGYGPTISNVNNFNTTANITIAPNVVVNAPVTIIPTVIAPVVNTFRPEFNVRVGDVDVNFGLDGVTFGSHDPLPPGSDIKFDPRVFPPDSIVNDNSISIGGDVDLTPVLQRIQQLQDEVEKCCDRLSPFGEPSTDEYDVQTLAPLPNGLYLMPPRTFTVTVEVFPTEGPKKTIYPEKGPRVLFAGWVWFKSQSGLLTRQPLDADVKAYHPPAYSSNEVVVSTYAGYTCTVRAWYAKANA